MLLVYPTNWDSRNQGSVDTSTIMGEEGPSVLANMEHNG